MAVKRQVIAGVATLAALYMGVSNALGLGELQLDSALNQPLSARIQLQGSEGLSADDIRVSLANQDAFESAGIDRPFFLNNLRFIPVVENNRLFIRVESNQPVREPYLNFLVELRRPNGRVLREYTLLLDPPLYNPQSGAIAKAPVQAPAGDTRRPMVAPAQPRDQVARSVRPQQSPQPAQPALPELQPALGADEYTTVAGDTLWDIAVAQRPDSNVDVRTYMLAIRALNPDAFIDGNINRLRAKQRLVLPTLEQLVTSGAPASIMAGIATDAPSQPRPETAPAELAAPDVVSDADPDEGAGARLSIEESSVEAALADSEALPDRLRSLEARFNVLLSELDVRNAQIASLQAELDVLSRARDAEERTDKSLAAVVGTGSLGGINSDSGPGIADGSDNPAPGSVEVNVLPGEESAEVAPSGSYWLTWLALPLVLIAFLLGLFLARRRSPDITGEDSDDLVQPESPGGFSSSITSVPAMVARPVKQAPKAPVDPLDGVELYITYGRFAEARIMLDKAIDEEPERLDLHYKQLRVLAELGDARAFAEQERNIKDLGGDPQRVDQLKNRFPLLFDDNGDLVEQVDQLEPLIDDDLEITDSAEFRSDIADEHDESSTSQLNLNDFTLDPDWDLIDSLSPEPARRNVEREAAREKAQNTAKDDDFETSLHELPEVEELDHDHDEHFSPNDNDGSGGRKR